jgi:hypothetical protein
MNELKSAEKEKRKKLASELERKTQDAVERIV